jgi:oxygen-dependent protoporphyrinogen oxidase
VRVDVAIVGGGISGLALAWRLRQCAPELSVQVLETDARAGGKLLSERIETEHGAFLVEAGPDSLLTQKPEALALVDELGMSDQLIPIAQGLPTAILHQGRPELMPAGMRLIVPTDLDAFRRSPLLSNEGKQRAERDLELPARESDEEESIAGFVRRRFGPEMVERLAEPILAGIHNGDPERLSLRATFPQLVQLERKHGSLICGMRTVQAASGGPAFVAQRDGMGALADELTARLRDFICTGRRVEAIDRSEQGFTLSLEDGKQLQARQVVLTTSAAISARLSQSISPDTAQLFSALTTNHAGSISLAVRDSAVTRPLPGYGLVIPKVEGRSINAITVASRKFTGRAPDGWTLLRLFFGGWRSPQTMELDGDELLDVARRELRELLGIASMPLFWRTHRWPAGNPQYEVGHLERIDAIERSLPPGLFVTGSAYRGVGIPDLVRAANGVAERLIERDSTNVHSATNRS